MEWPRGAVYDQREYARPAFLIYRHEPSSPIEVKHPITVDDDKRTVVATIHDLPLFCKLFGIDYPAPVEDTE